MILLFRKDIVLFQRAFAAKKNACGLNHVQTKLLTNLLAYEYLHFGNQQSNLHVQFTF